MNQTPKEFRLFSKWCGMYSCDIDFPFLRVLFECRVTGPLLYFTSRRGETIKGLIAHEMKKGFPCSMNTSCESCKFVDNSTECEYVRFFRFDLAQEPFAYVIIPPLSPRSVYLNNEKFSFEIRLFGECAKFEYLIKYLAPAIEQGGLLTGIGNWYKDKNHFGRFQMSSIYTWTENNWLNIFQENTGFIHNSISAHSFKKIPLRKKQYNKIHFYTPFCFKKNKQFIFEPSLEEIIYFAVMRLRTIYGTRNIKINDNIYENINSIKTIDHRFEESFAEKNLSYYIGNMEFEEFHHDLMPLLKLGSFCHLGKGTTQGYGGFFIS